MIEIDEQLLWRQWKVSKDEEKLNQLYKTFKPLIMSSVNRFKNVPLPPEAIELEAKRLFFRGLQTYNPAKGTKLNTHLINQMKPLYRYIAQNQNIGYIPEIRIRQIGAFKMAEKDLEEKLRRPPTTAELSEKMGVSIPEATRLRNELRKGLVESLDDFTTLFQKTNPKKDAMYYVYHELDPKQKLVFERLTGLTGKRQYTKSTDISRITRIPVNRIRKMRKEIALKLEPFKDL